MILHVHDVHLKVALLAEDIRCKDHQEFPKEFSVVFVSPPVALILSLSRSLGPGRGFDLRFGAGLF